MKQHLTSNKQYVSRILISVYALVWYAYIPVALYFSFHVITSDRSQSYPIHFGLMFLVCFLLAAHVSLMRVVSLTHSMSMLVRANMTLLVLILIVWFGMKTSVPAVPIIVLISTASVLSIIAWHLRRLPNVNEIQIDSTSHQHSNEPVKSLQPAGDQAPVLDSIRYFAIHSNTNFNNLRGMKDIKFRLKAAVSEIIKAPDHLNGKSKIRNGVLLFGQPGNGKTFLVECLAGEFGLPLISVTYGDVASKWINETTQNVMKVFQDARRQAPCMLLLDEIDSFIKDRNGSDASSDETQKTTNSILTEIVNLRKHGVVLLGATNFFDKLDKAAIREGRFDIRIEITPPDEEARKGILQDSVIANVPDVPFEAASIERLAKRWEGFSVKRIQAVGEELAAMENEIPMDLIDSAQMMLAMRRLQGRKGSIPESTKSLSQMYFNDNLRHQLMTISSRMIESERIEEMGGSVPTGLLFFGQPGTGKTETARSLAKETDFAFIATSGNDLIMNPSEIDRIIAESKDIRPCIVFIDEADDILANRKHSNATSITNKLLTAMDGASGKIKDIVYIAATNHPENMDPAALRGGRFTEKLFFQLPDHLALTAFITSWISQSKACFHEHLTPSAIAAVLGDGVSLANASAILQESVNHMIGRDENQLNSPVVMADIQSAMRVINSQS